MARPSRWGNPYVVGSKGVKHPGGRRGAGVGRYDASNVRDGDQDLGQLTAGQAVALYRDALLAALADGDDEIAEALSVLAGHDLACWCPLEDDCGAPVPCHGDVLLELANRHE